MADNSNKEKPKKPIRTAVKKEPKPRNVQTQRKGKTVKVKSPQKKPTPKASSSIKMEETAKTEPDAELHSQNQLSTNKMIKHESIDIEKMRKWRIEHIVADMTNIEPWITNNVIMLLNQDCTIPFIARYRKEMTGGLSPEKLREVEVTYENIKNVQKKASNVIKVLDSENKLNAQLLEAIANSKTIEEVEHLYAPYKSGCKRTLAERARQLGLEESATQLLEGKATISSINPETYVNPQVKGLESTKDILKAWQHIIADVISKDREVLDCMHDVTQNTRNPSDIVVKATKSAAAEKRDKQAHVEGTTTENFKFETYYSFSSPAKYVKAHQVLALNRGEHLKVLTVKVVVSDRIKNQLVELCNKKWLNPRSGFRDGETSKFIATCIEDAYARLLEPYIVRNVRSALTKEAEKESVAVFSANLKNLLLTPPIRGQIVLGIDPGFKHGCKLAVVSQTGAILETDVIYPHRTFTKMEADNKSTEKLKYLIRKHRCETVALGNGTACRETEQYLSNLISAGCFSPLDVKYCIVDESGVSIYSVTKDAEEEMPNMDPNMRSAVGIARRLQDPLLEYIKVEPKHLGVGMYQHDISETLLKNALDSVVVECVSFVGVDLNVAPERMLKKIAGLNTATAKNIVIWRETNGPFLNRTQLLLVKGLGPKSYEQCAGFVKILPQTCIRRNEDAEAQRASVEEEEPPSKSKPTKRKKPGPIGARKKAKMDVKQERNPLDATIIHPESYDVAVRFLELLSSKLEDVGEASLIEKVKQFEKSGLEKTAENLGIHILTLQLIVEALKQPFNYDFRSVLSKPLFRKSICSLDALQVGATLTGRVTNTTHFGAFVDVGVGVDGLIHTSQMKHAVLKGRKLQLGDRIEAKVINLQRERKRISLELLRFAD